MLNSSFCTFRRVAFLVALLPALLLAQEKPKGQRVMICGHSFHVFVGAPLAKIAEAAGIKDHFNAGTQSIGGSTVTQHWDLGDEKSQAAAIAAKKPVPENKVKAGLTAGTIDVLTLAPHMRLIPDPAIESFAKLAVEKNPNIRIFIQESWMIFDDMKNGVKKNEERDEKTFDQLTASIKTFREGLEKQAAEINEKLGKKICYVVPVGDAVNALRAKVIAGEVPGIKKQSELFTDPIGHVKEPVQRLEAYCYFAAIYKQSPVGLTVFEKPGDEDSHKLNQLLQELAWKTVSGYAPSGVAAAK